MSGNECGEPDDGRRHERRCFYCEMYIPLWRRRRWVVRHRELGTRKRYEFCCSGHLAKTRLAWEVERKEREDKKREAAKHEAAEPGH